MFSRIALILLLAAALGFFLLWNERVAQEPSEPVLTDSLPETAAAVEPLHPLPDPPPPRQQATGVDGEPFTDSEEAADPLPPLEESDAYLLGLLSELLDEQRIAQWLVRDRLAERLVVFVDSLDRLPAPVEMWPVVPVPGRPYIDADHSELYWSERNFARYRPLVDMLETIDPADAAKLYIRHHPILQEAHFALATETPYFNDRLVELIDHLLDSEDAPPTAIALEPYEALFRLADEDMEEASAGHKIMWRIGPEQAARVRDWLQRFRTEIASR